MEERLHTAPPLAVSISAYQLPPHTSFHSALHEPHNYNQSLPPLSQEIVDHRGEDGSIAHEELEKISQSRLSETRAPPRDPRLFQAPTASFIPSSHWDNPCTPQLHSASSSSQSFAPTTMYPFLDAIHVTGEQGAQPGQAPSAVSALPSAPSVTSDRSSELEIAKTAAVDVRDSQISSSLNTKKEYLAMWKIKNRLREGVLADNDDVCFATPSVTHVSTRPGGTRMLMPELNTHLKVPVHVPETTAACTPSASTNRTPSVEGCSEREREAEVEAPAENGRSARLRRRPKRFESEDEIKDIASSTKPGTTDATEAVFTAAIEADESTVVSITPSSSASVRSKILRQRSTLPAPLALEAEVIVPTASSATLAEEQPTIPSLSLLCGDKRELSNNDVVEGHDLKISEAVRERKRGRPRREKSMSKGNDEEGKVGEVEREKRSLRIRLNYGKKGKQEKGGHLGQDESWKEGVEEESAREKEAVHGRSDGYNKKEVVAQMQNNDDEHGRVAVGSLLKPALDRRERNFNSNESVPAVKLSVASKQAPVCNPQIQRESSMSVVGQGVEEEKDREMDIDVKAAKEAVQKDVNIVDERAVLGDLAEGHYAVPIDQEQRMIAEAADGYFLGSSKEGAVTNEAGPQAETRVHAGMGVACTEERIHHVTEAKVARRNLAESSSVNPGVGDAMTWITKKEVDQEENAYEGDAVGYEAEETQPKKKRVRRSGSSRELALLAFDHPGVRSVCPDVVYTCICI